MTQIRISKNQSSTCTGSLPLVNGELLLLHQEINEAANGIHIEGFDKQVGVSRERALQFLSVLTTALNHAQHNEDGVPSGSFDLQFCTSDGRALRNCMELVLADLGTEEFSIRTGFDFETGQALLHKMNDALFSALHSQQSSPLHSASI